LPIYITSCTQLIPPLEYAFYIDSKGNRLFTKFLIEWEGTPESFAFSYPYVMAFDSSFIEIRNVITVSISATTLKQFSNTILFIGRY
jgi:hypothetical protein